MPTSTIGERVRQARSQRGLTQQQLAARAGVAASSLSQIERDRTVPRQATLHRLAATLEVGLWWLWFGVDSDGEG